MVFQLFSTQVLVILAYALSVSGLALPADVNSLGKRDDGFVKLDFVVNRNNTIPSKNETLSKREPTLPLTNAGPSYEVTLNFGTDAQPITVAIDTGSSDLWVPSSSSQSGGYDNSKSSDYHDTGESFSIQYVLGSAQGDYVTDLVAIPGGPALKNFQFAEVTSEFFAGSGVLGVSYTSQESVTNGEPQYPNFPLALKNAGLIGKNSYSLYLNDPEATTGAIIFGGYDTEKFSGSLTKLPILNAPNQGLAVSLDSYKTSDGSEHNAGVSAILDSGTTLTYLPGDFVSDIANAAGLSYEPFSETITGVDCNTKLSGSIGFTFNGKTIDVPLQSQIYEYPAGSCQFGIRGNAGSDNYNLFGDTFLRNAYVIYNLDDNVIEIAQAKYTSASNIVAIN